MGGSMVIFPDGRASVEWPLSLDQAQELDKLEAAMNAFKRAACHYILHFVPEGPEENEEYGVHVVVGLLREAVDEISNVALK